ncbi:DNA helicase, partial [Tilletia horrida]
MICAAGFDKLESLISLVRMKPGPFGGLHVVLAGDFYQLPPLPLRGGAAGTSGRRKEPDPTFLAEAWAKTVERSYLLEGQHRIEDATYARLVEAVRVGQLSEATLTLMRELERPLPRGLPAVRLCSTRAQVEDANAASLKALDRHITRWTAEDVGSPGDPVLFDCPSPA